MEGAKVPAASPRFNRPLWRALQERGAGLDGFRFVAGVAAAQVGPEAEPAATGEAELLEPAGVRPVRRSGRSAFTHFLDGVERSALVGYVDLVPVLYAYVAAVLRRREERAFSTSARAERECVLVPFAHVPPSRWAAAGIPEDRVLDTGAAPDERHPVRLLDLAREAVKRERESLEREVALRWAQSGAEGWLLIDGPVNLAPALVATGRAVGVVKSHRTQFLGPDAMLDVLTMPPGHRSAVFRPLRPQVGDVYSWYVRLRDREGRDLYFGLVRVEAPAAPETLERADEITAWLLEETRPVALPDPRWDTLLYPIRDCETYLRARMPTLWPDDR